MNPTLSIKLSNKLVKADFCQYKVDDFYFASCLPELHFQKTKKLLYIKEYKELLEPILDHIPSFFTKMSENKTQAKNPQYNTLWKQFNCVTNFIWPYLHQFFDDSHGLNGYGKPLKRPFDWYQSRLEAISIGRDIRQINW